MLHITAIRRGGRTVREKLIDAAVRAYERENPGHAARLLGQPPPAVQIEALATIRETYRALAAPLGR